MLNRLRSAKYRLAPVFAGLLFLSSCSLNVYSRRDQNEPTLIQDIMAASVLIQTEGALGSGTVIQSNTSFAWVLTCHHVITESYGRSKTIHVSSKYVNTFNVEVIADDSAHDLALLKVKTNTKHPHISVAKNTPDLYERVFLAGNPLGDVGLVSEAFVSSLNERNTELPEERLYTLVGGYLMPGISGGTAANKDGELVCVPSNGRSYGGGIISNMGYCVSLQNIRDFLEKNRFLETTS